MTLIKNIWNHRRTNAWIFIELILVSIISWVIADPVVVGVSDLSMPTGYDNDRLLLIEMCQYSEKSPLFDSTAVTPQRNYADICAIIEKLRSHPDIASVTLNTHRTMPGSTNRTIVCPLSENPEIDSSIKYSYGFYYYRESDFFQTFGIKAVEGSPSVEELSDMDVPDNNKVIVTRQFGDLYWPGENPIGKRLYAGLDYYTNDSVFQTVVGVVEGIKNLPTDRCYTQAFYTMDDKALTERTNSQFWMIARTRDGIDVDAIKEEITPWARKQLKGGNYHLKSLTTYDEMLDLTANSWGAINQLKYYYILAGFFLVNLVLGTIGTFWLQTRKRIPEMGIRRAFGATRLSIVGMLAGENILLATAGCVIGFAIYWQFAIRNGLAYGDELTLKFNVADNWISHFGEHYLYVSLIVFALILLCVVVGTLIPALNVSRTPVVDAIRDKE